MKAVIAIDSFKGSMDSIEAGEAAEKGIRRVFTDAETIVYPLADGGEGTVQALALTWQQLVMYAVGITLIWLAIKKGFEPALLLPMGFGAILVNLPFSGVVNQTLTGGIHANGVIEWMFHVGIEASEVMPILLFIGIGAMIDFGPLLSGPSLFLFGAGAQFGIFAAILVAC